MTSKMIALMGASLALVSCDGAMEQLDGPIRTAVVDQCQQVSESLGIAGDMVNSVCECSADKFLEGDTAERTQIDRAKIENIVKTCVAEPGTATGEKPVEEPNA